MFLKASAYLKSYDGERTQGLTLMRLHTLSITKHLE